MFITPKIPRQQAENIFAGRKSSFPLIGTLFAGKNPSTPEKTEILYMPFYLFDVLLEPDKNVPANSRTNRQWITLSVDGLLGHTVLYATDVSDGEADLKSSALFCDFEISASAASKMALEQYKGILLEHGLRTRSSPHAKEISEGKRIFYPFWIAYVKTKRGYDFKALDAVSGEIQGIRMRRLFMKALKILAQKS